MTYADDWQRAHDARMVALNDHYERINRMWENTDLPDLVRQTPNWKDGYHVLVTWFYHRDGQPSRTPDNYYPPNLDTTWAREVHIFSHCIHLGNRHCEDHAATEEEGVQVVLAWWDAQRT